MDVKIICAKENYEKYKKMLEKSGFVVSNDSSLVLREEDFIQDTFIGEKDDGYEIIQYSKILYIESFGHTIVLHTKNDSYNIREKLYELEIILVNYNFIRINKSTIVAKNAIKKIKPTFNGRIDLHLINGSIVYVSKRYRRQFKDFIGF